MSNPLVDYSGLKYGAAYNAIIYNPDFEFMRWFLKQITMKQIGPEELVQWLLGVRKALSELEDDTALESWDDLAGLPFRQPLPGDEPTGVEFVPWAMSLVPGEDFFAQFSNEHAALLRHRWAAVNLYVEATGIAPISLADLPPNDQLALFLDKVIAPDYPVEPSLMGASVEDAVRPVRDFGPFGYFRNPAKVLFLALDYHKSSAGMPWEQWSTYTGMDMAAERARRMLAGLPDYLYHALRLIHDYKNAYSDSYLFNKYSGLKLYPIFTKEEQHQMFGSVFFSEGNGDTISRYAVPMYSSYNSELSAYYVARSLESRLATGFSGGCHPTSRIVSEIGKALNIPSYPYSVGGKKFFHLLQGVITEPSTTVGSHATVCSPHLNMALLHGDDVFPNVDAHKYYSTMMCGIERWFSVLAAVKCTAPGFFELNGAEETVWQKAHRTRIAVENRDLWPYCSDPGCESPTDTYIDDVMDGQKGYCTADGSFAHKDAELAISILFGQPPLPQLVANQTGVCVAPVVSQFEHPPLTGLQPGSSANWSLNKFLDWLKLHMDCPPYWKYDEGMVGAPNATRFLSDLGTWSRMGKRELVRLLHGASLLRELDRER